MVKSKEVMELYDKYVMKTYTRSPVVFARGKGIKIWDSEGREYLDFFPGWAVSGLGHCHSRVVNAIRASVKRIIHVSNNYYNELQGRLAEKICAHSFDGKVFFCNSGAEAMEGAIKLARKYGNPKRHEIIAMEGSFHGRTLAAITATGQMKYREGFEPLPAGFVHAPFNDLEAVKRLIADKTIAILVEPIQGEGGINVAGREYLAGLRQLCDEKDLLLIFDEVQTGMGRTGKMFCYQNYDVEPDVMTLAKTLGGGVPIGAMVVNRKYADVLGPGSHASTFGGSPLVCSASLAVFEAIERENLLENARAMGEYLVSRLNELKGQTPIIKEVRGMGLMLGAELAKPGAEIVEGTRAKGLLINCTQENVLRLMPPLVVTKQDIDRAIDILAEVIKVV